MAIGHRQSRITGHGVSNTHCHSCGISLAPPIGYWYEPDGLIGAGSSMCVASLYFCLPCGDRRYADRTPVKR